LSFIKDDTLGEKYFVGDRIKAPIALLVSSITNEDAGLTSKGQLVIGIEPKERVTQATKVP
jgi:hypothetical protein